MTIERRSYIYILFAAFLLSGANTLFAQQTDENPDLAAAHSASLPFDNLFLEANRALVIANYSEAVGLLRQCLSMRPLEASVHHLMAKAYKELEKPDEAIFHAGEAVRLNPTNHWYRVAQSEIYEKFNYHRQAADALVAAATLVTHGAEGLQLQAIDLYTQAMEYKLALRLLDQLEKKVGEDDDIIRRRYNILIKLGKRKQAEKLLEKLKHQNPESAIIRGALLNHYKYFKNTKKSENLLREWAEYDADNGEVWIELGNLYNENRQIEKAFESYRNALNAANLDARKRVEVLLFLMTRFDRLDLSEIKSISHSIALRHPFAPEPYALLGDILNKEGKKSEAIDAYYRTLRNGGDKESVYQQLLLLLGEEERYDEALRIAKKCIEKFPDNALAYALGAMAAYQKEQYDEAIELAHTGLPRATGNRPLRFQLTYITAESYHKLAKHNQSDEYFEKALNIDPQNFSTLNNYAYYLAERGEYLDKALVLIMRASKIQPNNPTMLDTWAWIHYKRGEYPEALEKIRKAIENGGANISVIQEHYGDILQKMGKYPQAIAAYNAALEHTTEKDHLLLKIHNLKHR